MPRKSQARSRRAGVLAATAIAGALGSFAPAQAVAGDPAADGSYAFTARLVIGDNLRACTGALVDRYWVLTAASCFADDPAQPQVLAAGAPKWRTTATVGRTDLTTSTGRTAEIAELVPRADRDLVMARLATPVDGIAPLAVATAAPTVGQSLRVPGYGRTKTEWVPNKLHSGAFTLATVNATGIGTTGTGGAAVCKGDTGAPVIRDTNGAAELVAVASRSWQGGCLGVPATETRTGVHNTRVDDLDAWVKEVRYSTAEVKPGTHVQVLGSDLALWDTVTDHRTGRWADRWSAVGTSATAGTQSAVDSVAIGNAVHVFAIGTDGRVYTRDGVVGGAWSGWQEIPGGAGGVQAITATARGNTVSLQVIGSDGGLHAATGDYTTGNWSGWTPVENNGIRAITSTTTADNVVRLYAIGDDRNVYTRTNTPDGVWTGWQAVPGGASGVQAITATARGNTVSLQVIGSDGGLHAATGDDTTGNWSGWTLVENNGIRAITSTTTADNVVRLYAIGDDRNVYTRTNTPDGVWTGWQAVPGGASGVQAITATTAATIG
ncbi:trypsin-like serine protease [Kitasatospora sp. NPDC005856]|uniref:trypsin-like serine protease n=1 Tax=Kitasatospora sp. NPDC005856 TaxID=3154566 RepID=UPI0033DE6E18